MITLLKVALSEFFIYLGTKKEEGLPPQDYSVIETNQAVLRERLLSDLVTFRVSTSALSDLTGLDENTDKTVIVNKPCDLQ